MDNLGLGRHGLFARPKTDPAAASLRSSSSLPRVLRILPTSLATLIPSLPTPTLRHQRRHLIHGDRVLVGRLLRR